MNINPETVKLLPTTLISKYQIFPLSVNQGRMTLIMADPLNYQAIDDVRISTGMDVVPVMASERELESAIQQYTALQVDSKMEKLLGELNQYNYGAVVETESPEMELADDAPVIRMVNSLLKQAVQGGASDIHIEPLEQDVRVRFRIDGELWEVLSLPTKSFPATVSRIKIMANLDISEKRVPQDGRTRLIIDGREIDFRISTLPSIHGEKIVLRILDRANAIMSLEKLGFSPTNEQRIKSLIRRPHGMVIVTGPTGSGKTTTLYTMIDYLNSDEVNIYTIENPVEKTIKNINQIQINELAGINYVNTLKALLRQDPDIIVVGEIRDSEEADITLRVSLTGHLVMTTIHANTALDSISRLLDMDIDPYVMGTSSLGFMSQRLVRTLCPYCKRKVKKLPPNEKTWLDIKVKENNMKDVDINSFYEPVGCIHCNNGYKGRIAVAEIVEVSDKMKKLISQKAGITEIKKEAILSGYKSLTQRGIEKVVEGKTSLEEIMKQTI